MVIEEIEAGAGVGVIISPRDVPWHKAVEYSEIYHKAGADVLIDLQFCNPEFTNSKLLSYPMGKHRGSVSRLRETLEGEFATFTSDVQNVEEALSVNGIIAPAIVYEAGRRDIVQLNATLFKAGKHVGDRLGVPTYASVILGSSVTSSEQTVNNTLSEVVGLDCDGWYYGYEFGQRERIPSSRTSVLRCCVAGLKLACTGKPVLHAYAGPMALLSMSFGAAATGVGQWQNLWQFTRNRWSDSVPQGGGGDAPPRLFSMSLWGTIVYPDEIVQLSPDIRSEVFTPSPFSPRSVIGTLMPWDRWLANKHLVYLICSTVAELATNRNARENAQRVIEILEGAVGLHSRIAASNVTLVDDTSIYQGRWAGALRDLLAQSSSDFEYLELLA